MKKYESMIVRLPSVARGHRCLLVRAPCLKAMPPKQWLQSGQFPTSVVKETAIRVAGMHTTKNRLIN